MEEKEKIKIALMTIEQNMSYGDLKDSSYTYGKSAHLSEEIWSYVTEASENGLLNFRNKYADIINNNEKYVE
tara:strand:+ start:91 stop:306 length:216 start_codon:yes stop_codon:yes gene_type:complete